MPQIDIDFEVFKQLTNRRRTESVTYNDVIRELLTPSNPTKTSKKRPTSGSKKPQPTAKPEKLATANGSKKPKPTGKPGKLATGNGSKNWVVSDTTIPAGSEFTVNYKGKAYSGAVKDGKLELSDGGKFTTPSAAAVHITKKKVNGWRFWKCKLPGTSEFVRLETLRGKAK